jgi:hypothetical protein
VRRWPDGRPKRWLLPFLIASVTFIVFIPVLRNGFVDWDDDRAFLQNPHYRGLGVSELSWMWTTIYMGQYRPLTWMTYGADYVLWGLKPRGYHLTNLLLHIANALLVYRVARRLLEHAGRELMPSGGPSGLTLAAGTAALLFAIHPLRVEPVAWVSARADMLAGLFLLLAVLAYLRHGAGFEALALYWLSLVAKPLGLSLPVLLVVLDVYPLRRLGGGPGRWVGPIVRGVWTEKVPFLAVALAAVFTAFLSKAPDTVSIERYRLMNSIAEMMFSFAFHLWKTLVPFGLSPLYERPFRSDPFAWPFLLSGMVVLALSGVLIVSRRRWPAALAVWVCYLALLAPTSGIIPFGVQMAADRFTYVSCVGWALLAGGGIWWAWRTCRIGWLGTLAIALLMVVVLASLGVLTWQQVQVWRDSETLWTHALSLDPKSAVALNNTGRILRGKGHDAEALGHFRSALQLRPDLAEAHYNLGVVLARQGKLREAVEHYREALELKPTLWEARNNLDAVLNQTGRQPAGKGLGTGTVLPSTSSGGRNGPDTPNMGLPEG